MAKKSHEFNELSTKVCATKGCDRRLKQRIVDLKPSAQFCFRCWQEMQKGKGNHKQTARASRAKRKGKPYPPNKNIRRTVIRRGRETGPYEQEVACHS